MPVPTEPGESDLEIKTMLKSVFSAVLLLTASPMVTSALAEDGSSAVLYKTPGCECCEGYASYLRENGFDVTVKASHDLSLIKKAAGVPEAFEGCHTTLVGGYAVEGHVPVAHVRRLLDERPEAAGISLPGMPMGSPGMSGTKDEPWTIWSFGRTAEVFAVE